MKKKKETVPIRIDDQTLKMIDKLGWIKEINIILNAKGLRDLTRAIKKIEKENCVGCGSV